MTNISNKKSVMIVLISIMVLLSLVAVSYAGKSQTDAAETSFRFVVMGDSRGSSDGINETTLKSLLAEVQGLSIQPEFIFFTGDQVMGGTDVAQELSDWNDLVDDYYPLNKYYPALGNHEDDETIFSNSLTHLPSNQLAGYQRSAYYFDYGNARFITLNSNRKDNSGNYIVDAEQRAWLESILNNNGKTHNFVQFHVPAYPIGAHYGRSLDANEEERDALWDILDEYNVTSVMTGHEHNYNRREIDSSFSGNGYRFENQIYQVTIGGAGAPLSTTTRNSDNVVVGPVASYHFMVVDVIDEIAEFNLYDINNNLMDSFTVERNTNSTPPSSTSTMNFQNGVFPVSAYEGTFDATLSENDPIVNYGAEATLLIDGDDPSRTGNNKYAVLKWDVSDIATNKSVVSVNITLDVTDASSSSYEIYELKRDWSEEEVTWEQNTSHSNWETFGADGFSDRGSVVLGTVTANTTGTYSVELNVEGISVVQSWVNDPSLNHGLMIANSSNTNGLDISSSEAEDPTLRPKLTVIYE
ncbi:DNRLRE domain-containing protein [Chengkuizengella axinellae]|uniref:DNRLRE domain-containing protein n=1 Tax=Chengkuizengella axinellae TaxID=3064388 RepID=A0ABT9J5W8_9BACL|nr:DNRLRE domain-containing protein [Chengkuizengella sp. 2205SS18-9]MDP5277011.1 DNRLRE domain-containing protein [Chengkuizengella sp. 2205SS18-9]